MVQQDKSNVLLNCMVAFKHRGHLIDGNQRDNHFERSLMHHTKHPKGPPSTMLMRNVDVTDESSQKSLKTSCGDVAQKQHSLHTM